MTHNQTEKDDIIKIFMQIQDEEFIKAVLWIDYKQAREDPKPKRLESIPLVCM